MKADFELKNLYVAKLLIKYDDRIKEFSNIQGNRKVLSYASFFTRFLKTGQRKLTMSKA